MYQTAVRTLYVILVLFLWLSQQSHRYYITPILEKKIQSAK